VVVPLSSLRWQLAPLAHLHWRRWADEWLLYDESSSQTLVLPTLLAAALMHLEQENLAPQDLAALRAALAELWAQSVDDAQAGELRQGLDFLVEQGLLQCVPE